MNRPKRMAGSLSPSLCTLPLSLARALRLAPHVYVCSMPGLAPGGCDAATATTATLSLLRQTTMQCMTYGCPWMGVERHTELTCDWCRWRDDGARSRTAGSRPIGRSGHETSPPDLGKRLEQAQRPTNTAPVEGEGGSHTCVSHGAARRCNASDMSPNLRAA